MTRTLDRLIEAGATLSGEARPPIWTLTLRAPGWAPITQVSDSQEGALRALEAYVSGPDVLHAGANARSVIRYSRTH